MGVIPLEPPRHYHVGATILATIIIRDRVSASGEPDDRLQRMIQYFRALDISWTAVITGYPHSRV
jgi:hypothetical protein